MRAFIAFTKKEITESARTYKLLIIFAVFFLFGMLNPITAKIMPELLLSLLPEGMTVTLAEPSALDSWAQFYKNMSTQLIIFVIVFSGIIANELSKSTLIVMLTKGLSRKTVILSKLTSATLIWTLGLLLCFATTYGYTIYLLPGKLPNIIFSVFCLWLFGVLLISVMLLGGVMFGNIYGSLLLTGGFSLLLMLLNIAPKLQKYNPYLLSSGNMSLLTSDMSTTDFSFSIVITCISILFILIGALMIFDKKAI